MSEPTESAGSMPRLRRAGTFGLIVAVAILIFDAFVAPGDGFDAYTLQQAAAIAVMIGAVPVALIVRPVDASRVVSLGGALTAAGVGTMFGGNLTGLLMAISGLPILFVGAYQG